MLFYSFFKTLVGKTVVVELKNDVSVSGTLLSVDPFLNLKLGDIAVADVERHPYLLSVKDVFIRGSVIRYVSLSSSPLPVVDLDLLQSACRKELHLLMNKATYSSTTPAVSDAVQVDDE
jgi:U6 snRNA-associated Sm-like protein LSm2